MCRSCIIQKLLVSVLPHPPHCPRAHTVTPASRRPLSAPSQWAVGYPVLSGNATKPLALCHLILSPVSVSGAYLVQEWPVTEEMHYFSPFLHCGWQDT